MARHVFHLFIDNEFVDNIIIRSLKRNILNFNLMSLKLSIFIADSAKFKLPVNEYFNNMYSFQIFCKNDI